MGLLDGKKGLILNVANDRSIAWHIGHNAIKHGATCGFGYLVDGRRREVAPAGEEVDRRVGVAGGDVLLHPCDVARDESIEAFFAAAKDSSARSTSSSTRLAFANKDYLKKEPASSPARRARCSSRRATSAPTA